MPPDRLLAELVRIASVIGLEIRAIGPRGKYAGPGGLCTIRGRPVVILNERTSTIERSTALADALAGRELSRVEMPQAVRGFIVARKQTRSRLLLPDRRTGPGLAVCRQGTPRQRPREN
jgi:hypothetical protein